MNKIDNNFADQKAIATSNIPVEKIKFDRLYFFEVVRMKAFLSNVACSAFRGRRFLKIKFCLWRFRGESRP
jgi:hypothetical protein